MKSFRKVLMSKLLTVQSWILLTLRILERIPLMPRFQNWKEALKYSRIGYLARTRILLDSRRT